jgi:excisionase family DNA binding protein
MTREELTAIHKATFEAVALCHKPLLSVREAAVFLGVSESFIYKAVESGRLAHSQAERKIFISREALLKLPTPVVVPASVLAKSKKEI